MRSARLLASLPIALTVALSFPAPASAFQEPPAFQGRPTFELADGALARQSREVRWFKAPLAGQRAWSAFLSAEGTGWRAGWDGATGVPARVSGAGVAAPGTVASPQAAESFARAFLARHMGLFAPGATMADFTLSSNDLDQGLRTVAFLQHHRGLPVLGGQLNVRFKNDRLFVIGSEALPDVAVRIPDKPIAASLAHDVAEAWLAAESGVATAGAVDGPLILPIVSSAGVREHRVVLRVIVGTEAPIGRYAVYIDARTGAPVAREQLLRFAQGTVLYNAPVRYPLSTRMDYPARVTKVTVDGAPQTTDDLGTVTFADGAPASVTTGVASPILTVINAAGAAATKDFSLDPGASYTWSDGANVEKIDAQLATFVHVLEAKARCKQIAPTMAWLNGPVKANVNINDVCNAFSDGTDVNFFVSNNQCENTGRIADVNYHEFGHSFHFHAILPGTGVFESALSEGQADYLAATMTGDAGTARGFFKNAKPLRDLDEATDRVWPDDIDQDPHETGVIIGGALWDLRKALVLKYGEEKGITTADQLYYQAIRRAADIPTMFVEVVAADDDDGNLENGTPNICEISAAFGRHGLRPLAATAPDFGVEPPSLTGFKVAVTVDGLFPQCDGDTIEGATLTWKLRSAMGSGKDVPMTAEGNTFAAEIPSQPEGEVVQYQVTLTRASGPILSFPDNLADPLYQFFVGKVTVLYATDFEADPKNSGWTHGLSKGSTGDGADDWQWGTPAGKAGSGDPAEAYSGKKVFGNDLGHGKYDGSYQPEHTNFALSPVVKVDGHKTVHLQLRRWLNVEDGHFDHATIYANDQLAWRNLDSDMGDNSHTQHQDKEWRFQDVDLTPFVKDGAVQVKFEIESDQGLELGGWTLDDLAIVAYDAPGCGDGVLDQGEACDDGIGNSDTAPDACRTDCQAARCGDGVLDQGEACDDGNDVDADGCSPLCVKGDTTNPPGPKTDPTTIDGCGCRAAGSSDGSPEGSSWGVTVLGLAFGCAARRRWSRSLRPVSAARR